MIVVRLQAVIVAVTDGTPRLLTVQASGEPMQAVPAPTQGNDPEERLPSALLDPSADRTLDVGLRRWVREQTGIELGYIEQLYTFGDRARSLTPDRRVLSIAYLALVRESAVHGDQGPAWRPWYDYFPWEDWRHGSPQILQERIWPELDRWIAQTNDPALRENRAERVAIAFSRPNNVWDPNRVLDRYEILYEAQLISEAHGDDATATVLGGLGRRMFIDHRRIVATALDRLRGKLSYRPVVFELLPDTFTLLRLQRLVEALAGIPLHKSNFRRLVEQGQLVERTGTIEMRSAGRPAELFRFRREVLHERPAPGVGLPRRATR